MQLHPMHDIPYKLEATVVMARYNQGRRIVLPRGHVHSVWVGGCANSGGSVAEAESVDQLVGGQTMKELKLGAVMCSGLDVGVGWVAVVIDPLVRNMRARAGSQVSGAVLSLAYSTGCCRLG